jgi:hypothetical protein
MKNMKLIIALALISATNLAYAGSSSGGRSDEGSHTNACMIPIQTSQYYQFFNVNMIRYVRVDYSNPTYMKIRYAENSSDTTINIEYRTKEEAIAATNKMVEAINNCGKKQ